TTDAHSLALPHPPASSTYRLSLHDALPIFASYDGSDGNANDGSRGVMFANSHDEGGVGMSNLAFAHILTRTGYPLVYYNAHEFRSEEHTSELQSRENLVCRLLLEKKKKHRR